MINFKSPWFISACVFGLLSLLSIGIAAGTNFWFEVKEAEKANSTDGRPGSDNANGGAYEDSFQFPYHVGLWMTCYGERVPGTVTPDALLGQNCVIVYDFATNQIEDFSRASIMCVTLAAALMVVGAIVGVTGFAVEHRGAIFHAGILFFVAAVSTMIGNSAFTARMILELNESALPGSVEEKFSWSYFVAWFSLGAQVVTGSILVACARTKPDSKK